MRFRSWSALVFLFLCSGAWGAVTSEVSRTDYVGNGSVAAYATTYPVKATTELRVFTQDADGQDVELALGADYSAVLNTSGLATITLTAGNLTNGYKLSIQRGIPYTQTYNPAQSGAYNAASLGTALDRLAMEVIRLKGDVARSIKIPYLEAGGDSVTKLDDNAATRANQAVVFDADGNVMVGGTVGVSASVWAQTLLDDANAAAGRSTLGISSAMDPVVTAASLAAARAAMGPWGDAVSTSAVTGSVNARSFADRARDVGVCVFDFMTAAQVAEIRAGTGGANAICADAVQAAVNSGAAQVWFPNGYYLFDKPVRLTNGVTRGLQLVGESRTLTIIGPSATNIAVAPISRNALFINQDNAGATTLRNLRFYSVIAYTGNVLYSEEGGGADGTCQALFSGQITDCYFSLSSSNSGYLYGGFNNVLVSGNTFETSKSCLVLVGPGNADILCSDNVMFNCYDSFIDASRDAQVKNLVSVNGLHLYGCFRDYIIKANNARNWEISNIIVGQENAAPLSPAPSLFEFVDSININASNCSIFNDGGPVGTGLSFSGCSGRFSNIYIQGADVGIKVYDTKANDLFFSNVVIKDSTTAAFRVASGAPTGRVRAVNCDWSDSQNALILHTSACAMDFTASHSRFYNAGIGGAASRNISMDTTGNVLFRQCDIGRDSAGALASYFIIASSASGEFTLEGCRFSDMAAPTGDTTGTQTVRRVAGGIGNRYRIHYASAVPASGAWNAGDTVLSTAPSAGGNVGWVCVTAGSPGTWAPFGHSILEGSATYDPASLSDGAGATTTVTVTGAALGDYAEVSFSLDLQGITATGYVSSANTVSVRFQNETTGVLDLASGTLRARVRKQ